jgi:hypothetical protein
MKMIPQHDPIDITYKHLAYVEHGEVNFSEKHLPDLSREELDELAESLRIADYQLSS